METGKGQERDEGWGEGVEDWPRLHALLELARRAHEEEFTPERVAQMRERVLARLEQREAQRRRRRALLARASVVLLAGLVLTLVIRARAA